MYKRPRRSNVKLTNVIIPEAYNIMSGLPSDELVPLSVVSPSFNYALTTRSGAKPHGLTWKIIIERIKNWGLHVFLRKNPSLRDKVIRNRPAMVAAVSRDPTALELVSRELQGDPEVIRAAVESNGETLVKSSEAMKQNLGNLVSIVNRNRHTLDQASYSVEGVFGRLRGILRDIDSLLQ